MFWYLKSHLRQQLKWYILFSQNIIYFFYIYIILLLYVLYVEDMF